MLGKKPLEEQSDLIGCGAVFPAQTLGKAPAGYDNAGDGIKRNIAWTVQA